MDTGAGPPTPGLHQKEGGKKENTTGAPLVAQTMLPTERLVDAPVKHLCGNVAYFV